MEKERKVSLSKDATPRLVMTLAVTLTLLLFSQSQSWAQEASKSNFYLKGMLGIGGIKKIPTRMWTTENEEVKVGTGFNIEGALGYMVTSTSMVEVGLGYQSSWESPTVSNGAAYFKRIPLTATFIYQFPSQTSYQFYFGGGGGLYLSPEFYREVEGLFETKVKYNSSSGFHGLVGVSPKSEESSLFWFGEFKYVGGIKYKFKEGTDEDGIKIYVDAMGWEEIDGNQWILNMGIGYHL